MLDHVSITVARLEQAFAFYTAIMAKLGYPCVWQEEQAVGFGLRADSEHPERAYLTVRLGLAYPPDRRHWAFKAESRAAVDAFHAAGLAHGGRCDGPPGLRPSYHADYYAAFLLDPDGNRIEAVTHARS
ncbi:MAG TPA: VOC family protein [Geminicoccus sp.]|jgi:catechol 2,3-dioxygenase-like lactoylglutathione lyase family enzyme|uniref:VOC family protein n=1 Tax=Geminicoccus sp. TaxID=2024832 RepID=UPI002E36CB13|nr:VOC family protein [Geminicoccus sp.]HEX2527281.1 VOC family protein [Geminicoccus sp.]